MVSIWLRGLINKNNLFFCKRKCVINTFDYEDEEKIIEKLEQNLKEQIIKKIELLNDNWHVKYNENVDNKEYNYFYFQHCEFFCIF